MKLSCIRCKQKKLRCDRKDPCNRCTAAGAVCAVADRKQRASNKPKDRGGIDVLNKRIELLERALQGQHSESSSPSAPAAPEKHRNSAAGGASAGPAGGQSNADHAAVDVDAVRNAEDALAQQLRHAKAFSLNHLGDLGQLVEASPLSQAITGLDGAVSDLGSLASVIGDEHSNALLTKDGARKAIQVALELFSDQCFLGLVDLDIMLSLGEIIASPHVQIDPAARLIYYNLLFHGYMLGEHKTRAGARTLYLQCLVAVSSWQDNAKGTIMDLAATSILSWTTIISFDYNLAWKFHKLSCRITKQLGLHHLDVLSANGVEEDSSMRKKRSAFWQLVLVDLFFRLSYDKGSEISAEASTRFVKLPEVVDLVSEQPQAVSTILEIIWNRAIFLAQAFFEHLDGARSSANGVASIHFQQKVDEVCDQFEGLIEDWQLVVLMEAQKDKPLQSWAYADAIVGLLNMVLQIDKRRQTGKEEAVSLRSVRASRMILDTIVKLGEMTRNNKNYAALYTYCIAFYPFRAFFALYYHILLSKDPELYREDVKRLERIDVVMKRAAQTRFEYIPISKAISSLNQVTKHMQQAQTSRPAQQWTGIWPASQPTSLDENLMVPLAVSHQHPNQEPMVDMSGMYKPPQSMQWLPGFGDLQFSTTADLQQAANQPDFEPIEYMQALENQFTGGNSQYHWWSSNDPGSMG